MELRFSCAACGQHLAISSKAAGQEIPCPACDAMMQVPSGQTSTAEPAVISDFVAPEPAPKRQLAPLISGSGLTCPVCWLRFDPGDAMHVAVHDSLRGDPVLGEDAPQRFQATRFNDIGQAVDAMGLPCTDLACPHCRRKFPPGFLDVPYHIISLVGDQSAGKSYFLSVLAKMLPASLYQHFGITCQDSDPTGNAPLNEMKKVLFSAQTPDQARLAKTQLEGSMYERLPRYGRMVALPKPFVYTLKANASGTACSLIFYDNAGEHFQPGINVVEQPGAQHVASAGGIMFLFDPFNSPEFRKRLGTTSDPQIEKPAIDQQDVILSEMRARIQSIRNLRAGERISTPLAVLVGKCDAWLHLLNGTPLFEPLENGELSAERILENSRRIRSCLLGICPTVVANAEALSTNVVFFAVSAFGHTPVKIGPGAYVPDPSRLSPVHVEIPPLWLLSQICPELLCEAMTA